MIIKNNYVKVKQGKNEINFHNLILNKYLNRFAYSILSTADKGLEACLINCTTQETITPSMNTMHWDFYLQEQNLYNNNDYKSEKKIITDYVYQSNYEMQITPHIGEKIYSIGFAKFIDEPANPDGMDATFELYAILDVSNYNLYVQDSIEFVVEREDITTTELGFISDTETFPVHLAPRGIAYFDEVEETGVHEVAKLTAIGTGYNDTTPYNRYDILVLTVNRTDNVIKIQGINIPEISGGIYPSSNLYPSNTVYPQQSALKWIFYEYTIYRYENGSYVSTNRKYYQTQETVSGNLELTKKYSRG